MCRCYDGDDGGETKRKMRWSVLLHFGCGHGDGGGDVGCGCLDVLRRRCHCRLTALCVGPDPALDPGPDSPVVVVTIAVMALVKMTVVKF